MRMKLSPRRLRNLGCYEILNSLAEGAYVTDVDRKILFWNHAAETITGWPAKDVIGHRCKDDILKHVDRDGHELCAHEYCPLHRSIVSGKSSDQAMLIYAQSKEGPRVPVEVTVAPIHDPHGAVMGGIELFREMTPAVADMLRAKTIQQTCLECPADADPRIRFAVQYTPSDIVGGDFYRVERTDDDEYAIIVADVMGHGVAAALFTVQLRVLWEDLRGRLGSPAKLLSEMSRRLRVLTHASGYYATAVCASLDMADGVLSYVCAGHPCPVVIHGNDEVELFEEGQPPLGLMDDVTYVDSQYRLERGDTVLMYTDGATEIRNAAEVELGAEGLLKLVRENVTAGVDGRLDVARLEEQLLQYSAQIRFADDLTLLAAYYLK